ncbi:MAG: hypothetical protein QNJ97_15990 [Myxococcota bacterium]|nr:hypothetical protein [Myxococcota bacterium]
MISLLEDAVRMFRIGMEASGSDALIRFVDAFEAHFREQADKTRATALAPILNNIIQAQVSGDFLYVADLLEYELMPLLLD